MLQGKKLEISWTQFELCNTHPQTAFEIMCRWLFNEFFFEGKGLLHSDPNNPGVEVMPKYHAASNKRISFQAKYFSSVDYEQIKHSARTAVSHYAGNLDVIYLYCNKDITTTSQGYHAVESILHVQGIEIVPITNQEILTQVMKNETIAWHFFDYRSLSSAWLKDRLSISLASLGPRYNDEFNVLTNTETYLNHFLCNADSVMEINRAKIEILQVLKKKYWRHSESQALARKLIQTIEAIPDISITNIFDCLSWPAIIKETCASELETISEELKNKHAERKAAINEHDYELSNRISVSLKEYQQLLHVTESIIPEPFSCALMSQQVLIIRGEAGVGKSQMFAVAAKKLVDSDFGALLLLGTDFINDHTIVAQIPAILGIDLPLDALLHKLEALAIQKQTYSYIFVDAINESTYKNIWKSGLPMLINQLKKCPHIKMAVSIRSGYEKIVLNDMILSGMYGGEIGNIIHNGFREESIDATLTFLNHYGIPFLPSYFLQAEMTNPLFLTLYCKNYTGENFDMYSLFDRLIANADREAQEAVGLDGTVPLLRHLIDEIAKIRLASNSIQLSQAELFDLGFWGRYGLSGNKLQFVASLIRSGFLIETPYEDTVWYSLGYNLLEDFVCARSTLRNYPKKDHLIPYLCNELLHVENGEITHYNNIDIVIIVCGLYADANGEECFEYIEKKVVDDSDRYDIADRHIKSFLWRKAASVNDDYFLNFINTRRVSRETVLRVLIENSAKDRHPLNAFFLHEILMNKTLARRDTLWTTFINHLADEKERIFQLIAYFDEGHLLNGLSSTNTELILILLTWFFTSSNRLLRDKASKAAIELLKRNFTLCKPLLQRFEKVNDPYVLQRLYGVVFGACVKRVNPDAKLFQELAEYVYTNVFDKEYVYPDILLRDYARLIVARWRYEYPETNSIILEDKITPPYNSVAIPIVEKQKYTEEGFYNSGFASIDFSMRLNHADCPGLYGDFGRYTFQSALQHFEGVDVVNLYHYAMQYIRDKLGYDDSLGEYDQAPKHYRYSRQDTKKIERIGKKYQWIAFYNILARVSDSLLLKEWDVAPYPYAGPWDPYVRDFDPTLNVNALTCNDIPNIAYPTVPEEFLPIIPTPQDEDIDCWKEYSAQFFNVIPSKLLLTDSSEHHWIALYLYEHAKNKSHGVDQHSIGYSNGSQEVWFIARAAFVKSDQFDALQKHINSPKFSNQEFPQGSEVYQLFNREYVWSPGFKSIFKEPWINFEIETGEYRTVKTIYKTPDYKNIEFDDDGNMILQFVDQEYEQQVPEAVIHIPIMPAYSKVLWEEQYDASQKETTMFNIPCSELIEQLHLEQRQADGYYYTQDGNLACFDGNLAGICNGLLFRADFLKQFLEANNLKLFWSCIGEKQYFLGDHNQKWSEWNGCYHFEGDVVAGNMINHRPI